MTDRELLELAAKAAGLDHPRFVQDGHQLGWPQRYGISVESGSTSQRLWNPLTDDGDALRLAVRLRLHACQFPVLDDGMDEPLGMVEVWLTGDDGPLHVEYLKAGDDRLAATRRAIVRAAAEIGSNT